MRYNLIKVMNLHGIIKPKISVCTKKDPLGEPFITEL